MSLFLWEIGCEDIPARMQQGAATEYQNRVLQAAKDQGVLLDGQEIWVSPRRLAIRLSGVRKETFAAETKTGPLVAQGDEALMRFCSKWGVQVQHCVSVSTPRGLAWSAVVTPPDIDLSQRLCAMADQVLRTMVWPKRMVWNRSVLSWIRPIRWMVCLLDDQVVSWNWDQSLNEQATICPPPPHLHNHDPKVNTCSVWEQENNSVRTEGVQINGFTANRWTEAHRLQPVPPCQDQRQDHATKPTESEEKELLWCVHPRHRRWGVMLAHAKDYESTLAQVGVMVSGPDRMARVAQLVDKAADSVKGSIYQATAQDLLMENAGLVQWPQAVVCAFDPSFLKLPMDVIVTALHVHQRCFCVVDKANPQQLLPYFIMIADGALPSDPIRIGYERVVAARLQDALFFWEKDQGVPLLNYRPAMEARLFFVGLGSFQDKTDRLEHVMSWIANQTGQKNDVPDIIAMTRLCKSDLFTSMVNEFPTLQGIMGGHYAIREGYSRQQADALSQPYRLARMSLQEVQTKSTVWGAWLTIADSLDTIVGFFALGKKPTGSKDPLALRRSCHGLIKALMVHGQHLSVSELLDQSLQSYAQQDKLCHGQFVVDQWWGFVTERLEFILKESGLVLPKRAYATLVHKWRAVWDTPTVWAQSKHYACVHQNHPAAVKAYDRLLSLQESCQKIPVSNQRDGLTTIWEHDALTMLQEPLNIQAMDRWSGAVDSLLDQVSIQDELLGGQRLGLIDDLIHLWRVWMPLDAVQE